jgi:hypothetical protein
VRSYRVNIPVENILNESWDGTPSAPINSAPEGRPEPIVNLLYIDNPPQKSVCRSAFVAVPKVLCFFQRYLSFAYFLTFSISYRKWISKTNISRCNLTGHVFPQLFDLRTTFPRWQFNGPQGNIIHIEVLALTDRGSQFQAGDFSQLDPMPTTGGSLVVQTSAPRHPAALHVCSGRGTCPQTNGGHA